jgi:hypothetical protein
LERVELVCQETNGSVDRFLRHGDYLIAQRGDRLTLYSREDFSIVAEKDIPGRLGSSDIGYALREEMLVAVEWNDGLRRYDLSNHTLIEPLASGTSLVRLVTESAIRTTKAVLIRRP